MGVGVGWVWGGGAHRARGAGRRVLGPPGAAAMVASFARAGLLALVGAAALAAAAPLSFAAAKVPGGIYPEGHFDWATEVKTQTQLELLVDRAIASEKTLMVRWIASEG